VLTEERFFKGSIADLKAVRNAVMLPILRKDFTIDEFQIYEAASAGADAVLLIVAALTSDSLRDFQMLASDLGMSALVEVHSLAELEIASSIGANLIGVNNRNLRTFEVSLDVSRELIRYRPSGALMIAESGISSREQIVDLKSLGFDGFLVGESLMRADGTRKSLEALI
jgi:indole-3-glycerol phosphate synthase